MKKNKFTSNTLKTEAWNSSYMQSKQVYTCLAAIGIHTGTECFSHEYLKHFCIDALCQNL